MALYLGSRRSGTYRKVQNIRRGDQARLRLRKEQELAARKNYNQQGAVTSVERPGIFRQDDGSAIVVSRQPGTSYVSAGGKRVTVGESRRAIGQRSDGSLIYAQSRGTADTQGRRYIDLSTPDNRGAVRAAVQSGGYSRAGSLFEDSKQNNSSANVYGIASSSRGTLYAEREPVKRVVRTKYTEYARNTGLKLDRGAYAYEQKAEQASNPLTRGYYKSTSYAFGRVPAGLLNRYGSSDTGVGREVVLGYTGGRVVGYFGGKAINYAGSKVATKATQKYLNYGFNRAAATRFGQEAGLKTTKWAGRAVAGVGLGAGVASVYGKSGNQVGAMLPGMVAGGAGFAGGYRNARVGYVVDGFAEVSPSKGGLYRSGDTLQGQYTSLRSAQGTLFGKPVDTTFATNTFVTGSRSGSGYALNVDTYGSIPVGRGYPVYSNLQGFAQGSRVGLRNANNLYFSRTGRSRLFMSDGVSQLYSTAGTYGSVNMRTNVGSVGRTKTYYEPFDYTQRFGGVGYKPRVSIRGGFGSVESNGLQVGRFPYAYSRTTGYDAVFNTLKPRDARFYDVLSLSAGRTRQFGSNEFTGYRSLAETGRFNANAAQPRSLRIAGKRGSLVLESVQRSNLRNPLRTPSSVSEPLIFRNLPLNAFVTGGRSAFAFGFNSRSTPRVEQSFVQSPFVRTGQGRGGNTKPFSFQSFTPIQNPRQDQPLRQITPQLPLPGQRTRTPVIPGISTPVVPPPPIIGGFMPGLLFPISGATGGSGSKRRGYDYRESIAARLYGITTKDSKNSLRSKLLGGFEVRPLSR